MSDRIPDFDTINNEPPVTKEELEQALNEIPEMVKATFAEVEGSDSRALICKLFLKIMLEACLHFPDSDDGDGEDWWTSDMQEHLNAAHTHLSRLEEIWDVGLSYE